MVMIPGVNVEDLPTSREPWDEDPTYKGTILKLDVHGPDKNGDNFLVLQAEVTEPEDRMGRKINDNYISLPKAVMPEMTANERRDAVESGVRLAQLARSAHYVGPLDTDKFIGREITFLVKNEEYQGDMVPKIAKYIF